MKKIFLLLFLFSLFGCEKDDICDSNTSTTPKVYIEFYDFLNQTTLRSVPNLKIKADAVTDDYGTFSGNSIKIPLDTSIDATKYSFILNSTDTTTANEDFIEFNYSRNQVFVSRACGYKTVFELNDTNGIVHTDSPSADAKWIQQIDVETTTIDNENEVHVKIYF